MFDSIGRQRQLASRPNEAEVGCWIQKQKAAQFQFFNSMVSNACLDSHPDKLDSSLAQISQVSFSARRQPPRPRNLHHVIRSMVQMPSWFRPLATLRLRVAVPPPLSHRFLCLRGREFLSDAGPPRSYPSRGVQVQTANRSTRACGSSHASLARASCAASPLLPSESQRGQR